MLRSVDWLLFTDFSGQPIGPSFKGQLLQEEGWKHAKVMYCVFSAKSKSNPDYSVVQPITQLLCYSV
jgi:hypothetical protein